VTRARAPGKLVLSGSYSVLWGAPALVAAVDRFALADSEREPVHVADEVLAAVKLGFVERPCFVDASALRTAEPGGGTRKLGLGSSAAILLATMVALRGEPRSDDDRRELFANGLAAHREAQGGGSGIDVAASTFGGVLRFVRPVDGAALPSIDRHELPGDLRITVFAADRPAVTAAFVARVRDFAARAPAPFAGLIERARGGALAAVAATDADAFVRALAAQRDALAEIGREAGVPIVTSGVAELGRLAAGSGAAFVPLGAGGGDVAFYAGAARPEPVFIAAAAERGLVPLALSLGAPGAARTDKAGA